MHSHGGTGGPRGCQCPVFNRIPWSLQHTPTGQSQMLTLRRASKEGCRSGKTQALPRGLSRLDRRDQVLQPPQGHPASAVLVAHQHPGTAVPT